jgi:hypothetical protein
MMNPMEPITLLIAALATARLTRLVTTDRITEAPRTWALRRLPSEGLLAYLLVCDWCVSVYTGAAVASAGAWAGSWPWAWAVPLALAFSYTAGYLARGESE